MRSLRALGTLLLCVFAVAASTGACAGRSSAPPAGATAITTPTAASVSSFGFNVLDLDVEVAFLRALRGRVGAEEDLSGTAFDTLVNHSGARARRVEVKVGDQALFLTRFQAPLGHALEIARANDAGFEHVAIVVSDMDAAYAELGRAHVRPVSPSPQTLPPSNPVAAGVRALYFRDPEGHFLELLQFPAGKGDEKWHRKTAELVLGIDHSAISVAKTGASLAFYRDVLGMKVVSESINEGREQELLSGVPGARVRITSLHGASGPGIELLEYLAPRDGAAAPATGLADTLRWEIAIEVDSVESTLRALRLDPKPVASGPPRSVLARDPDGHVLRISERPRESEKGAPR